MTKVSSDSSPERERESGNRDAAHQRQNSQQSMRNAPDTKSQQGAGQSGSGAQPDSGSGASGGQRGKTGIGSSQGQDRGTSERDGGRSERATGTPDVERGSDTGSSETLVNDPTGAFKERP